MTVTSTERRLISGVRTSDRPVRRARRPFRLPDGVAFYLQASIVVSFLAGSSAPTPLYATYQREWGFSPITTTVVFGIYALAVLAALLTFGSLSDHVGRRPVLLAGIGLQMVTMLVLASAGGVAALLLARVIQGLATGAALGALGAGMIDLNRARGTVANAVAPMTGTAVGGIASGLLVQYLPAPTHLVYVVLLAVLLLQGIGVVLMRETSAAEPGALASLRPRLGVPAAARHPLLVAVPVAVAVWALAGFYGSVGPAVVARVTGSASAVLGGAALFVLAAGGALTVLLLPPSAPHRIMSFGSIALIAGVGTTLVGISLTSATVFFVGAAVAGAGFGAGFQGAIRTVIPLAAAHERAGLLSAVYVVSYLAMGLPAVVGGYLVVDGGGLLPTAREYGAAVMVLAALALAGTLLTQRERTSVRPAEAPRPGPVVRPDCPCAAGAGAAAD